MAAECTTFFVDNATKQVVTSLETLYTPNESLGVVKINTDAGFRRITNLFWEDLIYVVGENTLLKRHITFDWWVEQKPEPAEPVQTEIPY